MKINNLLHFAAGVALAAAASASLAATHISIAIGQPGFYGFIDIGDAPPPALIYQQPRVIVPASVVAEPFYLRVPPRHRNHWKRYCGRYQACNQPVYFVSDDWYQRQYVPYYQDNRPVYEQRRPAFEQRHNAYRQPPPPQRARWGSPPGHQQHRHQH